MEQLSLFDDNVIKENEVDFEPPKRTKIGDIWQLGRHHLMCGDSTKEEDVAKLMNGNKADMVCTDPPYKTTSRGNAGNSGGMLQKKINMSGKVFKENDIKPADYAKEFYRILKKDKHCYIMTNHKNLIEMLQEFTKVGFHFIKSLIWNKGNKIMGQFYMSQFEYILFFRKGAGIKINNCGTSDILSFANNKDKDSNGKNLHDTQKPIELMKVLILNSSNENDIVLDLFGGSGSTLIACEQLNRVCYMMELDPHYVDVIIYRWEKLTNRKAILL